MIIKTIILDKRITRDMLQPATSGSAGIDLRACIDEPLTIKPGQAVLIPSGIAIHINDSNYAAYIHPRSGKGHKEGLCLGNLTGIIDADYTGQIFISAWNRNQTMSDAITIKPMDKIAQMVIGPVMRPQFHIVESFDETERGAGGFGSTDNKYEVGGDVVRAHFKNNLENSVTIIHGINSFTKATCGFVKD